jgi:hypothetical protein
MKAGIYLQYEHTTPHRKVQYKLSSLTTETKKLAAPVKHYIFKTSGTGRGPRPTLRFAVTGTTVLCGT